MGARGVLIALLAWTLATAAGPWASPASASCGDTGCGVPTCTTVPIRARPDMAREVTFWCSYATSAHVVEQPAHGTLSPPTLEWSALVRLTVHMAADAPRFDNAVLEVTGPEGTIEAQVQIETIPTSENHAPFCSGDHVSQRSDGAGPVDIGLWPNCWDADGDEFVVNGTGPGQHLDAPKSVGSNQGVGFWRYRTATAAGTETTSISATDILGARSEDAPIEVSVGPAVDSLPSCAPGYASYGQEYLPIYSRPGATRRFGIRCTDADGDPYTTALTSPPARGAFAAFTIDPLGSYPWGSEHWIDVTYQPTDTSTEPDEFTVTATGERGAGPNVRMAIVPMEPPWNSGGAGCGWSGLRTAPGVPGTLTARCDDGEGDPLTFKVVGEPLHGTAGPPVVTPDLYGQSRVDIEYVPSPGYEGYDCVKIVIEDGYGMRTELTFDIDVAPVPPLPPFYVPPVTQLPPIVSPLPSAPPPPTRAQLRAQVRMAAIRALGTRAVARVRTAPAEVWVRRRLSKRDLLRRRRAPAAFVVCSAGCRVRSEISLAGRSTAASRGRNTFVMSAWQPRLVSLAIGAGDRRALRAARNPRATLRLAVRGTGGKSRRFERSIAIGG